MMSRNMGIPCEHSLQTGDLVVQFDRSADRYSHSIWLAEGSRWNKAVSSVEGTPTDDWPPSPPFQSLEFETHADGSRVALLVGMAGQSHWSASVEIDAAERVRFDVACRTGPDQIGPLGSAYCVHWPPVGKEPHVALVVLRKPNSKRLIVQVDGRIGISLLTPTADGLIVTPSLDVAVGASRTIRWSYTIAANADLTGPK